MRKTLTGAATAVVGALAMACGGGGSGNATITPPPAAAVASPPAATQSATTQIALPSVLSRPSAVPSRTPAPTPTIASPTAIIAAIATVKQNLPVISDKAKNGDLQSAKDAIGMISQPIEIIATATRPLDAKLARSIELHKLALDNEITSTPPDPIILIQNAIQLGPLIDEAATLLRVAP